MKITVFSDTHSKHGLIKPSDLPGGEILIFSGDLMNSGYSVYEVENFFYWFSSLKQYETKIFITGNHDRYFENQPEKIQEILSSYSNIDYLQDEKLTLYFDGHNGDSPEENIHIYGTPYTPEFHNWAFNLPKGGIELKNKWEAIPEGLDILITHGPPQGILDTSGAPWNLPDLGCELLRKRVELVQPKIHVFGHIHGGYGYRFVNSTHFINSSVLDEKYEYVNKPITFSWDKDTNEVKFP